MMKNKLVQLRENKNLTQQDLSDATGISIRTIQRIEAGKEPKGYTLQTLISYFQLSLNYFSEIDKKISDIELEKIKQINASALLVIIIPFGNIIFPFYFLHKNRKNKTIKKIGIQILSIHIFWFFVLSIGLIILPFLLKSLNIKNSLMIYYLVFMYVLNISITVINAKSLQEFQKLKIKSTIELF